MNFGPQASEADSFAIMDRALEHGINFFDTANAYGGQKAVGPTLLTWTGPLTILYPGDLFYLLIAPAYEMSYLCGRIVW